MAETRGGNGGSANGVTTPAGGVGYSGENGANGYDANFAPSGGGGAAGSGNGGNGGQSSGGSAGAGGSGGGFNGASGGNPGGSPAWSGAGGGEGGQNGGTGGTISGNTSGGNGGVGGSGIISGGGGGAGGYGYVLTGNTATITNSVTGGSGGNGGGASNGAGGEGGVGGGGLVVTQSGVSLVNQTTITGGVGGQGGSSNYSSLAASDGRGGAGGDGVSGSSFSLVNSGTIIGGPGGGGRINGAGGSGVAGSNVSVELASGGSIWGGLSGDGATRGFALEFTGGANTLTLTNGTAALTGGIGVTGGVSLQHGGTGATIANAISGSGTVTKTGAGTITLSATNTYNGATTVSGGTLVINGSIAGSAVTVQNGATLGGSGTVGALTVQLGGTVGPGNSAETLDTGNFNLQSGSTLEIEIGGTTVGTQYDQVNVTGTVTLAGSLDVSFLNAFAPSAGQSFTIINNDGTDLINGTFSGLLQGATLIVGGERFTISYTGGTGNNDVVLTNFDHNTAPTPGANNGSTVAEGGTDTITSGELDFNDAEQDDNAITYTVTGAATNGTLRLNGNALGVNDTFTQADINAGLITFLHDGGETTSASFGFSVSDGAGGSVTAQIFNFIVTPVNDRPFSSATPQFAAFTENGAPVDLFANVAISTVEAGQTIIQINLVVTFAPDGANESLSIDGTSVPLTGGNVVFTATNGMTVTVIRSGDNAAVTIAKAGGISAAAAQTLIDGLTYSNSSEAPTNGARAVTVQSVVDSGGTADGGADTSNQSFLGTLFVNPVNDLPTVSGLPASFTVPEDTSTQIIVSGNGISFADADSSPITVTIAPSAGQFSNTVFTVEADALTTLAVSSAGLIIGGPPSAINFTLNGLILSYRGDANATGNGAASLIITADDGTGAVQIASIPIDITPVNDAPTATGVPSNITVASGIASNVDLSAVAFTDVDSGAAEVTFTIAANSGTLAASSGGGVTISGSATGTLTLTGTTANIDAYLNTASNIQYTSAPGALGNNAATLTLTANDNGNTGTGGGATVPLAMVNLDIQEAPSLIVTTLSDVVDAFDGVTSLREAIAFANSNADASTITFATGLSGGVITLGAAGQLNLSTDITIDGDITGNDNRADITISGDNATRVFSITAGTSTLEALTIANGRVTDFFALGAGIEISGSSTDVTVSHSTVTNNTVDSSAVSEGGGIFAGEGRLSIVGSTLSNNAATGAGDDSEGGALSSTNSANVEVINSTFTGNSAEGDGGAILTTGALAITNSTITGNSSGVDVHSNPEASLTQTNSIIAGNGSSDVLSTGVHTLQGGNIIGTNVFSGSADVGDTTLAGVFASTANNANTGVLSGVLADNGGPVQTVALNAAVTNPALDASNATAPATDARGLAAVDQANVANINSGARDLGAFEVQAQIEAQSLVVTTLSDVVDAFDAVTSLREAIAFANSNADASTITFATGLSGTITLTQGELVLSTEVTIDGDNTGNDNTADIAISGNDASRIFNVAGGAIASLEALTVTDGRADSGGAIYVAAGADLTITHSTVSNSVATAASTGGGGVSVDGHLALIDSLIVGNAASGAGSEGGGILLGRFSSAEIVNTTLAGNSAVFNGGGIRAFSSVVEVRNSTITGNISALGGGITQTKGLSSDASSLDLSNSLVLGNAGGDIYFRNSTLSETDNLIGTLDSNVGGTADGTGAATVFTQTVDVDPGAGVVLAGVLADNGGPVQTVALNAAVTNPALDASNTSAPAADARGVSTRDYANIANAAGGSGRDLGAYELDADLPAIARDDLANLVGETFRAVRTVFTIPEFPDGLEAADAAASVSTTVSELSNFEFFLTVDITGFSAGTIAFIAEQGGRGIGESRYAFSLGPDFVFLSGALAASTASVVNGVTSVDANGTLLFDFVYIGWANVGDALNLSYTAALREDRGFSGALFADNGNGVDFDPDSDAFSVSQINGVNIMNGQVVTLPSGARLTIRTDGTFDYDTNGAFDALPAAGSGASNPTTFAESFTYAITGGATATMSFSVAGQDSNDILRDTTGADILDGGVGNDIYFLTGGADTITDVGGVDQIRSTRTISLADFATIENLVLLPSAIDGTGNGLANAINGSNGVNRIDGGGANDRIAGNGGDDTLIGGEGNDTLNGGAGVDSYDGGAGDDIYVVDSQMETITDSSGIDQVRSTVTISLAPYATIENLILLPGAGDGTGNGLANIIIGNNAANRLDGAEGNDRIAGNGGIDTLIGGEGNDILNGGDGSDVLQGGAGRDILYGGADSDSFEFVAATDSGNTVNSRDIIADFAAGDRISLAGIDTNDLLPGTGWSFIGSSLFGLLAGQLRFEQQDPVGTANDRTIVFADLDGDAEADFQIELRGLINLTQADFILDFA